MLIALVLLAPVVVGAIVDVRTRRIPNWLTLPTTLAVLVFGVLQGHFGGSAGGAASAAVLALIVALVARGNFGMGDVKLLTYAGAAVGIERVALLLTATALVGGVVAMGWLLVYRRHDTTFPYGPAIAGGCALALLLP